MIQSGQDVGGGQGDLGKIPIADTITDNLVDDELKDEDGKKPIDDEGLQNPVNIQYNDPEEAAAAKEAKKLAEAEEAKRREEEL